MKITIDQDKRIGSGQCVLAAADVFDQLYEDGIVTPLTHNPPPELHQAVRQAVAVCPALAITVVEEP